MLAQLKVIVKRLNKRKEPVTDYSIKNIVGTVSNGFIFRSNDQVSNELGKWYKDNDGYYYWGGGLTFIEETIPRQGTITPALKKKIEQIVNIFETGAPEGNYAMLARYQDYNDPETESRIVQVTYGRSQTTEFSHLKDLIEDYVERGGLFGTQLKPYVSRIGKKPSLATDESFCKALRDAGKNDPIMRECQNRLFDAAYYEPAFNWFTVNGFTLPLSLLVIYDSKIHSGSILGLLRKRFSTVVPAKGGNEKEWISNYVIARHDWLANHSNPLLPKTIYRTKCFKEQIENNNWDLEQKINANGTVII